MRIRLLAYFAAMTVMVVGGRPLAAQQMSPYGMMGGYNAMAPMGYAVPAGGYMQGVGQAGYLCAPPAPIPAAEPGFATDAVAAGCNESGVGTCGTCGVADCGCGGWCHCVAVFGEYLYLRPRNAEVAYGVPINGPIVNPVDAFPLQVGPVGIVDPDFQPAFRFGFSYLADGWSSLTVQYTRFEASTANQIGTQPGEVIRSLVTHPAWLDAAQDFLTARASQDLTYDLFDVDFRRVISSECNRELNWLVGARYMRFEEDFASVFTGTGTESVITEIDFDGAGLRFGLEGEALSCSRRWFAYGKAAASFIAGEFRGDYALGTDFDPEVVDTRWKAGRVVPILDLEVGVGWQSRCGTWRLSAGYLYSAWYNVVKTNDFIEAVQMNDFNDLSGTMTFDGLVGRVEGRF